MSWIKRLLYGVLLGLASIAPGISGGTIAIALGFYRELVDRVANLFHGFRKNFNFLFPFGLGTLISIAGFSVVINYLFSNYALPTSALFIGFIVGTLPFIIKKGRGHLKTGNIKLSHWAVMVLFLIIVLFPVFFRSPGTAHTVVLTPSAASIAQMFAVGLISAATLVIPGLSGTMILTALGYYKPLLNTASTFVTSAVSLDFKTALQQSIYIIPMGLGLLLGIFLTAKLISFLFRTVPSYVYAAISGLIIATPVVMLWDITFTPVNLIQIFLSVAMLVIGFLVVQKLGDQE